MTLHVQFACPKLTPETQNLIAPMASLKMYLLNELLGASRVLERGAGGVSERVGAGGGSERGGCGRVDAGGDSAREG